MAATAHSVIASDQISQFKEHFASTRDALTGLHNKLAFKERVDHLVRLNHRYSNEFSLLVIGVQSMHLQGSSHNTELLTVEFAKRLRCSVRSTDTIARIRDDMYAVLLPMVNSPRFIARIVDNIVRALGAPFHINDEQYFIDLHAGIALYPADGDGFDEMLTRATRAMRRARGSASDKFQFYSDAVNTKVRNEQCSESQLMCYIENQRFNLLFQPVLSGHDNRVAYLEVCVDWPDTALEGSSFDKGMLVLDRVELNALFYQQLIKRVCVNISQWEAGDFEVPPLVISLSDAEFLDHNLAQKLEQCLAARKIDSGLVILATHENNIINNFQWAVSQIRRLNDCGFRFAINHFWHALTHLNELKSLRIELLIFSPDLADMLQEGIEYYGVIQGVNTIAKSFNMQTVITGLDTEELYLLAGNLDVDYRQGSMVFDVVDESLLLKNVLAPLV